MRTSDGTSTGWNPDSTTDGEIQYTWYASTEGVFLFHDMADAKAVRMQPIFMGFLVQ